MCCNRSPEVELSEAAALSDVFVFRLMFRLYWLPRKLADYLELVPGGPDAEAFYQKKRLLSAYAGRKSSTKVSRSGKAVEYTKYLMISALAVDTSPGACAALSGNRCGIYERRPLACRTVPFHYSRAEALAESDLKAFVDRPDYGCDTGPGADVVLQAGRIVDPALRDARDQALLVAQCGRRWKEAIVRRMNGGASPNATLPSFQEIELNAGFGATTTSMRVAWQIAANAGLIAAGDCEALVATQLATIERELAAARCAGDGRQTLSEMRSEYRSALASGILAVNG
jgi:Fe-S-cluster containining protein